MTVYDIEADNDKLRSLVADLTESVHDARKEVTVEARVPSSALGRLKQVFDSLAVEVGEKVSSFSKTELGHERQRASDELHSQATRLEAEFDERLKTQIDDLTAKHAEALGEATRLEKEATKAFKDLKSRSENSEELLQNSEDAHRKAEEKAQKAIAGKAKLDENLKKTKDAWAECVTHILEACTLKAQRVEEDRDDPSKPWRAKQRSLAEKIQKDLDKLEEIAKKTHGVWVPGEQLKFIAAAYEEAKKTQEEQTSKQLHDLRDDVARAKAEVARVKTEGEEELTSLRTQLQAALELQSTSSKEAAKRESALQLELGKASKVAKEQAGTDVKRLEGELEQVAAELATAQADLQLAQNDLAAREQELEVQVASRGLAEEQLQTIHTKHNAKLSALWALLHDARSAGTHGGYYFAAAPMKQKLRSPRSISPGGSPEREPGSPPSPPRLPESSEPTAASNSASAMPQGALNGRTHPQQASQAAEAVEDSDTRRTRRTGRKPTREPAAPPRTVSLKLGRLPEGQPASPDKGEKAIRGVAASNRPSASSRGKVRGGS